MMKLTKAQQQALLKKYQRNPDGAKSYREFRRRVTPELCGYGTIMLPWCGMWVGIEPDGYAHT